MPDSSDAGGASRRYQLRPRRRFAWRAWFRRLLVLAMVVALHQWWGERAARRLDRRVLALAAAGEPTSPGGLLAAPIPDYDNAVPDLRAAAVRLDTKAAEAALTSVWDEDREPGLPLTQQEKERASHLVAAHQDVVAQVRQARPKRGVAWDVPLASPLFRTPLHDLTAQRDLARFLEVAAIEAHERGDDAEALERLRDVLLVSRAAGRLPFVWSAGAAGTMAGDAADRLAEMAPALRISAGGGGGAARPELVAALIGELLDDAPSRDALRHGFQWQRVEMLDTSHALAEGRVVLSELAPTMTRGGPPPSAFEQEMDRQTGKAFDALFPRLFRAMVLDDGALMLDHVTHVMAAAESSDWPSARRQGVGRPAEMEGGTWAILRHLPAALLLPHYERVVRNHYSGTAGRRLAATALALRWYACDHGGALPARLDDLVPAYLRAVPVDPLAEGARPLGYVRDAERPVVYSVGENGVDNGGYEPKRLAPRREWHERADEVRHLKRRPRPLYPLTSMPGSIPTTSPADAAPPPP